MVSHEMNKARKGKGGGGRMTAVSEMKEKLTEPYNGDDTAALHRKELDRQGEIGLAGWCWRGGTHYARCHRGAAQPIGGFCR